MAYLAKLIRNVPSNWLLLSIRLCHLDPKPVNLMKFYVILQTKER